MTDAEDGNVSFILGKITSKFQVFFGLVNF